MEQLNWLDSADYFRKINLLYESIVKGAEQAENESQTSQVFEQEIYYLLRSQLDIKLDIQKEKSISGVHHSFSNLKHRKSGRGRLDAIVNNLVIEYKHHSKLKTEVNKLSAIEQTADYLRTLYTNSTQKYDAILTDGLSICYFSFIGKDIRHTSIRTLQPEDIDKIIKAIINIQHKKFDPKNIVSDFSVSINQTSRTRKIAQILYNLLMNCCTGKTNMLYEEWKVLMRLSTEDNGKSNDIVKRRNDLSAIFDAEIADAETEYKALFALQTTYAIIVKLIACKVTDQLEAGTEKINYPDLLSYSSAKMQAFFQQMEDGYTYTNMGVRNFLEGDYFSWYADKNQWSFDFWKEIQNVMQTLDEYSAFSMDVQYNPIDVFKDLYMHIIPQSVRHSMGEYFTPDWLADCVIEGALNMNPHKNWKAIDPCCGSGIFVISLIKKIVGDICVNELTKKEKEEKLNQILTRVYGVDINPLSVLSARVSYFMAIHPFGNIRDIEIPIYLGDSAVIPKQITIDGILCYTYRVDNTQHSFSVTLPTRFVRQTDFGKNMNELQALVQVEDSDLLFKTIINMFEPEESKSLKLCDYIRTLADDLVLLHQRNWDGIWVRIVTNFMLIARLQEFDYIVGNPPWVKWEHLPQAYAKKINTFCDVRHIFCNDGGMFGGAQLNICALISNVVASNWLSKNGVLAFLMPDSLMSQNSYEEYRNFYLNYEKGERLYLQHIDRWTAPLRPFRVGNKCVTQDFNTYYFSSNRTSYVDGVPVREITRTSEISDVDLNKIPSFVEAKDYLRMSSSFAKQLSTKSTAFTYVSSQFDFSSIIGESAYEYRTGVESTPFEVYKMIGIGSSSTPKYFHFINNSRKTSKYKVTNIPTNGWHLPTEHIYPMVEGPRVRPFGFDFKNNYHIVPYLPTRTKSPLTMDELMKENKELALYFAKHKDLLEMQAEKSKVMHRGEEFYALSKIGPYTFAPFMVAARDNTNFCSTVVSPVVTQWGAKKMPICVKHTIIISQGTDKHFITEDEAHYINGILNSSIVHEYIHNTFKTNGFSLKKSHLKIPIYNKTNSIMKEIVNLSKSATSGRVEVSKAQKKLSDLYLQLCTDK